MDRPRRSSKRQLFPDSPEKLTLSKEERRKETTARYRAKLKDDPERFAAYRLKESAQKKAYREGLSDDKKALRREKTRLRNIAYRERQRQIQSSLQLPPKVKPATRADAKKVEVRRERNRLVQQKRRLNMNPQKKRRERERNRHYHHRIKADATAITMPDAAATPEVPAIPSRSSIYRLRKKMGKNLLVSLKGLVRSVSKKNSEPLKSVGITYSSPSKKTTSPTLPAALLKKRDKSSLAVRRFLQDRPKLQLYLRKKKLEKETADFFNARSQFLPGKKGLTQNLTIKKALDRSIVNLHHDFIEEHGPLISKATFFHRRPKHITSFNKTPFRQCLCEICINPMLKVKTLNRLGSEKLATLKDLLRVTLCEGDRRECLKRACDKCGVQQIESLLRNVDVDAIVSWHKWDRLSKNNQVRVEMIKKEGPVHDLVKELREELHRLPLHDFVHRWQSNQFSSLIKNLPSDWAVIVFDFAENYVCKQQDQPQSAYYGYSQVTVHPCVIYYGCACGERVTMNWTFLSDIVSHSADMVNCITQRIFDHLMSLNLKKIVIFSDGCSSQYKSRLPFFYLQSYADFPFEIERCYFGARHGKNPCDALGGLLKQAASRAVRARTSIIQDAKDLLLFATSSLDINLSCGPCTHMSRKFFLLAEQDISSSSSSAELKTLSGTRQLHSLRPVHDGLLVRNLSCFCSSCVVGNFSFCQNKNHVDVWKIVRKFLPNNSFLNEGLVEEVQESPDFVDQPIQHTRESFFDELQAKFNATSSFHDLQVVVMQFSTCFKRFPLPNSGYKTVLSVKGTIDSYAMQLFSPKGISHLFPVNTVADGNCVPRSLSLHCFGDQDHHTEVRCRIVCELVSNCLDYLCLEDTDELNFLVQHSDCQSVSTEGVFQQETLNVSKSSTFMGMWQLMAVANVFQTDIISVYPSIGPKLYQSFFNRTIRARNPSSSHCFPVFWSSSEQHSEDMPHEYWTANHMVPLMPLIEETEITIF